MKFKLDENIGRRGGDILRADQHDVATVHEQQLTGAADPKVIDVCRTEGRCLVTLDLDFGNPLRFRPRDYRGIVVLRLPPRPSADDLIDCVKTLAAGLTGKDVDGKLWIVQRGAIREYSPADEADDDSK
ncbi:MAG: DUF5615 family PIN-like protein [Deltaproteobacteria bacterium]|nr:DUF5615 family PIN-like protein [Deltaproteobacteria bacterium]